MSSGAETVKINFEGIDPAAANRYAQELRDAVLDANRGVEAEIVKDDPTTMDMGATLILVLGTPAVIALATGVAKAIVEWQKKRRVTIKMWKGDSYIEVDGDTDDAVAEMVEHLSKMK